MLHRGGKNHHAFAGFGVFNDLADDVGRNAVLLFQLAVKIRFAEQAVASGLQAAEIVLHDRHIQPFWRHQEAVFNHIAQRQFINAVAKQAVAVATGDAVVVILIDPAFAQPVRGGRQTKQAQLWVGFLQVLNNLLVLAVVIVADAVAFVDDQQGKCTVEQR